MPKGSTQHFLIGEADTSPNNEKLPLILYKGAVQFGDEEPESVLEEIFWGNAWADGFRDGIFPFHHYHSNAHEVVGFARGRAVIQFGGPTGTVVEVEAGDTAVIPAGVSHCRLDDAPGISVVGAYPHHQVPDVCVLSESDEKIAECRPETSGLDIKLIDAKQLSAIKASIATTILPDTDPIWGNTGPISDLWLAR